MKDWMFAAASGDAVAEFEQLREDLVQLRRSFEEVSETAVSADGLVRATVGGRGELTGLFLDPRVYRVTDSTGLAELIMVTIGAAVAAVTARVVELTRPFVPDGDTFAVGGPDGDDGPDLGFDPLLRHLDRRIGPGAS